MFGYAVTGFGSALHQEPARGVGGLGAGVGHGKRGELEGDEERRNGAGGDHCLPVRQVVQYRGGKVVEQFASPGEQQHHQGDHGDDGAEQAVTQLDQVSNEALHALGQVGAGIVARGVG